MMGVTVYLRLLERAIRARLCACETDVVNRALRPPVGWQRRRGRRRSVASDD